MITINEHLATGPLTITGTYAKKSKSAMTQTGSDRLRPGEKIMTIAILIYAECTDCALAYFPRNLRSSDQWRSRVSLSAGRRRRIGPLFKVKGLAEEAGLETSMDVRWVFWSTSFTEGAFYFSIAVMQGLRYG